MKPRNCQCFVILVGILVDFAAAQPMRFEFAGADALPSVEVNGELATIHTQGLVVTDDHYWVTGRCELVPHRALLLRYPRKDLQNCEFVDITPPQIDGETLDHPGGFDMDSSGRLWIPLSTSHARGPSMICRYAIKPAARLEPLRPDVAFKVDDHIGAVCLADMDSLFGANWDTELVYRWSTVGRLISVQRREQFVDASEWRLAVQDWKSFGYHQQTMIIAGGIDQSGVSPRGMVQIIDAFKGRIYETHRLPDRRDVARPLTNEGLAVHNSTLYLLPEDIGRDAKVLRFKIIPNP